MQTKFREASFDRCDSGKWRQTYKKLGLFNFVNCTFAGFDDFQAHIASALSDPLLYAYTTSSCKDPQCKWFFLQFRAKINQTDEKHYDCEQVKFEFLGDIWSAKLDVRCEGFGGDLSEPQGLLWLQREGGIRFPPPKKLLPSCTHHRYPLFPACVQLV